ncbi:MAG: hypothetical protein ACR2FU_08010 [Streptosporangiaceae bacterium]
MSPSDHAGIPPGDLGRGASAPDRPEGRKAGAWIVATILLIAAIAGSLLVPIYARTTPMLGDFRVPDPGCLHLRLRAAGTGADRI